MQLNPLSTKLGEDHYGVLQNGVLQNCDSNDKKLMMDIDFKFIYLELNEVRGVVRNASCVMGQTSLTSHYA